MAHIELDPFDTSSRAFQVSQACVVLGFDALDLRLAGCMVVALNRRFDGNMLVALVAGEYCLYYFGVV